jgi:L-lactate dehydrogenase complex protein LldF
MSPLPQIIPCSTPGSRLHFPQAVLPVLRNPQLRKNVAHAIDVIQAKRAKLVAEKTDWQELRSAASAIRMHALENLGAYLEEFEARCTAAGGTVHWAADAAEARQIILDLLRQENASEVIKIKTMTSAEIQLNPFLEAAGVSAFETDLAEIILQLGEEEPSHIVVPALHINRSQVREIFARRMGLKDLSDDPKELTNAARTYLRKKFLTIPTAISGANFLIAETGGVAVVESEGNGRMCLTLPRTMITLAGIREGAAPLPGSRSHAPGAGPLGHRRAHESLYLALDRRHARRRPAALPCGSARQRPLLDPRPAKGAADPQVHPLRRLHEHLPGLPPDRRPRLRLGLSRPHRSHPHAATDADAPRAIAALRLLALRRLLRGLPGQDQHSRGAARTARPGRQPGAPARLGRFFDPMYLGLRIASLLFARAWRFHAAQFLGRIGLGLFTRKDGWIHSLPSVGGKWTQTRDLRGLPSQTFHELVGGPRRSKEAK